VEVCSSKGKRIAGFRNSLLFTHFGLSGPAVLDVSRYLTEARVSSDDQGPKLRVNLLPAHTAETLDRALLEIGKVGVANWLANLLPDRLARALCEMAGIGPGTLGHAMSREQRRELVAVCTGLVLPIMGDRGYTFAEATAGGVPLNQLHLDSLESRVCAGLYVCGELCDVDGRVGGFNFQWAWSSGYVAGSAAAKGLIPVPEVPTLSP